MLYHLILGLLLLWFSIPNAFAEHTKNLHTTIQEQTPSDDAVNSISTASKTNFKGKTNINGKLWSIKRTDSDYVIQSGTTTYSLLKLISKQPTAEQFESHVRINTPDSPQRRGPILINISSQGISLEESVDFEPNSRIIFKTHKKLPVTLSPSVTYRFVAVPYAYVSGSLWLTADWFNIEDEEGDCSGEPTSLASCDLLKGGIEFYLKNSFTSNRVPFVEKIVSVENQLVLIGIFSSCYETHLGPNLIKDKNIAVFVFENSSRKFITIIGQ